MIMFPAFAFLVLLSQLTHVETTRCVHMAARAFTGVAMSRVRVDQDGPVQHAHVSFTVLFGMAHTHTHTHTHHVMCADVMEFIFQFKSFQVRSFDDSSISHVQRVRLSNEPRAKSAKPTDCQQHSILA